MNPLLLPTLLPAAAIALGATAITSQPSFAATRELYAVDADSYANTDSYAKAGNADNEADVDSATDDPEYLSPANRSYSQYRMQVPERDLAYRARVPAYHYAYYSIARPEYLL